LSTSYEAETVVVWGALSIITTLLVLLVVATVRGLLYARSIAASVSKLDHGVRAIRRGAFGVRIEPREKDQLGALAHGFNEMSSQLQTLLEERAAHRVVERELEIARTVQARLFPQQDPRDEHLEAVGVCVPARAVSGDYYDFLPIRGGWDLLVADVSGKGMSAALLMASLQASLRGQYGAARETPPDPARALDHVNRHLATYAEATRFVTLFLVRYDGGGELEYCNAGHNPALVVRDGGVQWLREGGLMLGPFPERPYRSTRLAVRPGDLVCLYTDGVTEAMDPHSEEFGEERLAQLLQEQGARPLGEIRRALLERVKEWRQGGAATDDVTFVLVRILAARD
jgi:sigma-B regulation protein RsbU (phosphoserine phosphatase)